MSGGHGADAGGNKKIALLISVLALFLALAETMAKSSQTTAISSNVEASNLWAFFQAKTIRQTVVRTFGEAAQIEEKRASNEQDKSTLNAQIDTWKKTVARWESEPETQEGRKELVARAKAAEDRRDLAMSRYHHYEVASAAFQIGIVLASASVITGLMVLAGVGAVLGGVGLVFIGIGLFIPNAVHLL
jgi:Domain of unknown function (DUF4337)